jgi:hypothetical protein
LQLTTDAYQELIKGMIPHLKRLADDKFMDLRGLSEYSGLGVGTLRDYLKGPGALPHFKLKGRIVVRRSEFDQWMERYRVSSERLQGIVDDVMKSLETVKSDNQSDGRM